MSSPLKITFRLATPLIPPENGLLHLDGLIAYAVVQEAIRLDKHLNCASVRELQSGMDDVLDRELRGDDFVYKASCLAFNKQDPYMAGTQTGFTKRPEYFDMARAKADWDKHGAAVLASRDGEADPNEVHRPMIASKRKNGEYASLGGDQIQTQSTIYRMFNFFLPTMFPKEAVAYCIGDKDAIGALLTRHILSLGRKGSSGFGMVSAITVDEDGEADALWQQRTFPWEMAGYVPMEGNSSPPYWDATRKKIVWVPVEL